MKAYLEQAHVDYERALLEQGDADDPLRIAHGMGMALYPGFAWGDVTLGQIKTLVDSGLICYAVGQGWPDKPAGYPEGIDVQLANYYEAVSAKERAKVDIMLLLPYGERSVEEWTEQLNQWLRDNTSLDEQQRSISYGVYNGHEVIGTTPYSENPPQLTKTQALMLMKEFTNARLKMAFYVQDNPQAVMDFNARGFADGVFFYREYGVLMREWGEAGWELNDQLIWYPAGFDKNLYPYQSVMPEPVPDPIRLYPRYAAPADRTY
nr:hypothetical protein [bacterium]